MDCKEAQSLVLPYIRRELDEKQLEKFIGHIQQCEECREELEIYFTIHFALRKLDEEMNESYDIKKMLQENITMSARKVRRRKILRATNRISMLLAEVILILVMITQIQVWKYGGIEHTTAYAILNPSLVENETKLNETGDEKWIKSWY